MCGIVGAYDLTRGRPPDGLAVMEMAAVLAHRGPDDVGDYVDDQIALGVTRLAIVAPSNGAQPLFDEARQIVLIGNGEVYDHAQLRRSLEASGHVFRTQSDLEIIVHLYEESGLDALRHLNGQFAIALWDRRCRRLTLARDRFGICPLFYVEAQGELIFASEIKAILAHPSVATRIDPVGLDQVLMFPGLVSPRTMFEGVKALAPGQAVVAGRGLLRIHQYWDLCFPLETDGGMPLSDDQIAAEIKTHLRTSVARRLQGDAGIGVLLSGGLDSTAIAATMRELRPAQPIHAYSAAFPGQVFDESRFQAAAAAHLGLTHRQISFDASRVVEGLARMVWHAECPVKESYNVCSLALARAAREDGLKVLLSGEGADEIFFGYPGYRLDAANPARRTLVVDSPDPPDSERPWGKGGLLYERDYLAFRKEIARLYHPDVRDRLNRLDSAEQTRVDLGALRGRHVLNQRSYLDMKLRLADHLLGDHADRMLYASGVEGRFPFLDPDLVDFAVGIPPHLKISAGTEKYILKRAMEADVPQPIRMRQKRGFRAFGSAALLAGRDERSESLLAEDRLRRDGWFDVAAVQALKRRALSTAHEPSPFFHDDFLLVVLTFNLLIDEFGKRIPRARQAPVPFRLRGIDGMVAP